MANRFLSFTLGLVFLAAGAGKLFVLEAFASTIAGIIHAPLNLAFILAVTLISVEAAGAVGLLFSYKTRALSLVFCVVVGVFIWVLASAIVQGKEIACNCFGILGINLANRHELLLDIVLFNLFGFLGYMTPMESEAEQGGSTRRAKIWTGVLALCVVMAECTLVLTVLHIGSGLAKLSVKPILRYAERTSPGFATRGDGNRLLFVMRHRDLGCPACNDDFMSLADSVHGRVGDTTDRVLAVFERDGDELGVGAPRASQWAITHNFPFPVIDAPGSLYDSIHFHKSSAIVIGTGDSVLLQQRFPMGLTQRLIAQQLLKP
jgi:hypothetical protein